MEKTLFKQENDEIRFWQAATGEEESEGEYWVRTKFGIPGKIQELNYKYFDSRGASDYYFNKLVNEQLSEYSYSPSVYFIELVIDLAELKKRMSEEEFENEVLDLVQRIDENLRETGNGEFDDSQLSKEINNIFHAKITVINKELALKNLQRYFAGVIPKESISFKNYNYENKTT